MSSRFTRPNLLDRVRTPAGHVGRITEMSFSREGTWARIGTAGSRWWPIDQLVVEALENSAEENR